MHAACETHGNKGTLAEMNLPLCLPLFVGALMSMVIRQQPRVITGGTIDTILWSGCSYSEASS